VVILDEKAHFNKRLISEMIHIKKQSKNLNLQKDTELLDPIYSGIIDRSMNSPTPSLM